MAGSVIGNVGPERRVRHQHVDRPEWDLLVGFLEPFEVPSGELKRIHVEDVALRAGRHHQFIVRRANEGGIEVGAEEIRFTNSRTPLPARELLGRLLATGCASRTCTWRKDVCKVATRKPPVPQAGSSTRSSGLGSSIGPSA